MSSTTSRDDRMIVHTFTKLPVHATKCTTCDDYTSHYGRVAGLDGGAFHEHVLKEMERAWAGSLVNEKSKLELELREAREREEYYRDSYRRAQDDAKEYQRSYVNMKELFEDKAEYARAMREELDRLRRDLDVAGQSNADTERGSKRQRINGTGDQGQASAGRGSGPSGRGRGGYMGRGGSTAPPNTSVGPTPPKRPEYTAPMDAWAKHAHIYGTSQMAGVIEDPKLGVSLRSIRGRRLIESILPAYNGKNSGKPSTFPISFAIYKLLAAHGLYNMILEATGTTINDVKNIKQYDASGDLNPSIGTLAIWIAGMGLTVAEIDDAALCAQAWIRTKVEQVKDKASFSENHDAAKVAKWVAIWVMCVPTTMITPGWTTPVLGLREKATRDERTKHAPIRVLHTTDGTMSTLPDSITLTSDIPSYEEVIEQYVTQEVAALTAKMDVDSNGADASAGAAA